MYTVPCQSTRTCRIRILWTSLSCWTTPVCRS